MTFPLQRSLAEYGFESRDNYDFAIQCFLNNPLDTIRCLYVDGDPGRRKTAFAHALGQALNYEHVLYFEFGVEKRTPEAVKVHVGDEIVEQSPTEPFDRVMTEACALSEADTTVLIIDQLHKAEFQQHIRLYEFTKSKVWAYSDAKFYANPQNLLIFLISSEELYHSLQQSSFRIWVNAQPDENHVVQPESLGLDLSCLEWLEPLGEVFAALGVAPTLSEYRRIAFDIVEYVRTREQLKTSLFGWVENIDRKRLNSRSLEPVLDRVVAAVENGLGIQEEIELSSTPND